MLKANMSKQCLVDIFYDKQLHVSGSRGQFKVNDSLCLLQGHMYSLGSTLSAALDFVIEPELEAELGEEIQRLLEQMQEEGPEDRPHPQVRSPSWMTFNGVLSLHSYYTNYYR